MLYIIDDWKDNNNINSDWKDSNIINIKSVGIDEVVNIEFKWSTLHWLCINVYTNTFDWFRIIVFYATFNNISLISPRN
jgi:hypothetical protein